ncbi:hypothetical protein J6590_097322 [Homalodisca vitripennis]|nr:hypothetical protein J6590_097322 [Homalodisca vitripennis]
MSNDGFPVLNDKVAIENSISKKRKYDPESYKRNIIKCFILKGKSYTNHKGNFVNEKRPKLSCGSDLKGYITVYSTIDGLDKQIFFMSAQSGTPSAPNRLAYPGGKIPLKEAKANDIKKALQYVPVEHLEFYNEIVNGPIGTAEEEDLSTSG